MEKPYRIWVPEFGRQEKPEEQPYLRLWTLHALLRNALPSAGHHNVSTAYCAWYHLWWRAWNCFTSVRGCYEGGANFGLRSITRAAQELGLHIGLITQIPVEEAKTSGVRGAEALVRQRLTDRYKGYLAWIFHNELSRIDWLLRPDHLAAVYEPETARQHAASLRKRAESEPILLQMFPEPETLTDAEAEREMEEGKEILTSRRQEIEWNYQSPELKPWRDILDATPGFIALESLLDGRDSDRPASIGGGFRRLAGPIGALGYQLQSEIMHGSTWSAALRWNDGGIMPGGAFFEDTLSLTESAISALMWAAVPIATRRPQMED